MEKFNLIFGQLKVSQLGFVFKDIEEQGKIMEKMYGLTKFAFLPVAKIPTKYKGIESDLTGKLGFSQLGETQIELIEWKEGNCPYKDFLDQGREGFHHVGLYVDNIDPHISEFERKKIGILFSGAIGKGKFAYMDTEKSFGLILEFIQLS